MVWGVANRKETRILCISIFAFLIIGLSGCVSRQAAKPPVENLQKEIIVSAAASLQEAMNEIKDDYAIKKPDVKVTLNFGSSGTLQYQIEQGAPVDVFISAGIRQMDTLENKNLLTENSRLNLLGNELALITAKDNNLIKGLDDLDNPVKVGIGTPETVPAGQYAREALVNLGRWEALNDKLVFAKDVKQVLTYVETGNTEAGFVYLSDAKASDKVKIVATLPGDAYSPIVYPAAIVRGSKEMEAAHDFMEYLQSPDTESIFIKYGFKLLK